MFPERDKDNNRGVYKKKEFEIYARWYFLPVNFRGQPKNFFESLGILNDEVFELAQIMSQKEFAEKYDIKDTGTLTDWNKRLEKADSPVYMNFWKKSLDPTVVFSLFKKIYTEPKGNDVKHWNEISNNY